MDLQYRLASMADLDDAFALIRRGVSNMINNGIYQWDEIYPSRDDLKTDIEKGQLYLGFCGSLPAVIFVINREYDPEYDDGVWQYTGEDYRVVHRLCVDPNFQNRGIARRALLYVEELLKSQGIKAIRLDTFTQNPFALKLYAGLGYKTAGYADWRKGRFVLLEKVL